MKIMTRARHGPCTPSAISEVPYKASVFDVVHDHGFSTAFFANKEKFELFARSWDSTNGAPDVVGADNGTGKIDWWEIIDYSSGSSVSRTSSNLVSSMLTVLTNENPTYTFLHLADLDITGHTYTWGSTQYRTAARHLDAQLGRILKAIDTSPALSNTTAIVITADHGGGVPINSHTTADALVNYTIPLVVWGPGIPAGGDPYALFSNRSDPGTNYLDYNAVPQPLRNGDSGNIALALLGLPPIPGSCLIPAFGAPGVRLTMLKGDGYLELSWPASATDYVLIGATTFSPNPDWQEITEPIFENNGVKTCLVGTTGPESARYFRLIKPTSGGAQARR